MTKPAELDEMSLVRLAKDGDKSAMTALLNMHDGFIKRMALFYANRTPTAVFDDLLAEGRRGLMHGVHRFDMSRDIKLLTYAGWHVRATIQDEVRRVCSNHEFAIGDGLEAVRDEDRTSERQQAAMDAEEVLAVARQVLTQKELSVLISRYGLEGEPESMLKDIAERNGVTKEAIRLTQSRAERKLREALSIQEPPSVSGRARFAPRRPDLVGPRRLPGPQRI